MKHKAKSPGSKKARSGKAEISVAGYDVTTKALDKGEVLAEIFARVAQTVKVKAKVALASSLDMVKERYVNSDVGSVGDGVFFVELGLIKGLGDYCVVLARLPGQADWKTIDGKKVRLVWVFGFHDEADREFVANFVSYLAQNLFDPGVWKMLMGKEPMPKLAVRLEKFIEADIKADMAFSARRYKDSRKHYEKALEMAQGSSRVKIKMARLNELLSEGNRVLKAYKDAK